MSAVRVSRHASHRCSDEIIVGWLVGPPCYSRPTQTDSRGRPTLSVEMPRLRTSSCTSLRLFLPSNPRPKPRKRTLPSDPWAPALIPRRTEARDFGPQKRERSPMVSRRHFDDALAGWRNSMQANRSKTQSRRRRSSAGSMCGISVCHSTERTARAAKLENPRMLLT